MIEPGFSTREREVMRLLAMGWSTRDIAMQAGVTHRTVEHDLFRLRTKLQARNVGALREIARRCVQGVPAHA